MTNPLLRAWPVLLTDTQLAAYLNLPFKVAHAVCPVGPLDVGGPRPLWSRLQIDEWIASLPVRRSPDARTPADLRREAAIRHAESRTKAALKVRRRRYPG